MNDLWIASFRADVTPAVGEPMFYARDGKVSAIEHPMLAKGILLKDATQTCVLCAIDACGVCNESYEALRSRIAAAAGTTPSHVALQSVHQHTANIVDNTADRYAGQVPGLSVLSGPKQLDAIADRIVEAVGSALSDFLPLNEIGTGWAAVDQLASNRRVRLPDGRMLQRMSGPTDPILHQAPEGLIDGYLRTVAFRSGDRTVAHLHYYASHPQSYYGDGRVTWDVPGLAREPLESRTGIHQVYFTGCAGQIAFGKYNDGQPSTRPTLVRRLDDAMRRSIEAVTWQPADTMHWRSLPLNLEARTDAGFAPGECRDTLNDPAQAMGRRVRAAAILAWHEHTTRHGPVEVSRLAIGQVSIVHLPGEPFLQYQLWAQRVQPNHFVCVAGYGDCGMWYLPTDAAYDEPGGYEQSWAFAPPSEEKIKRAIDRLLTPK